MYTKEDLKEYLKAMGLTGKETILVHSSMKSIGEVEGRADTVIDALIEYFTIIRATASALKRTDFYCFQPIHGKILTRTIQYTTQRLRRPVLGYLLICFLKEMG